MHANRRTKHKKERHNTEYERGESITDRSEKQCTTDELGVHSNVIGSEDSNGTEHLRFGNAAALLLNVFAAPSNASLPLGEEGGGPRLCEWQMRCVGHQPRLGSGVRWRTMPHPSRGRPGSSPRPEGTVLTILCFAASSLVWHRALGAVSLAASHDRHRTRPGR